MSSKENTPSSPYNRKKRSLDQGKDGKQTKFNADHYFYRVEFQQRGAPHIHSLLWLKGKEENGSL